MRRLQPPNYGIISGILMHLIRCVSTCPAVIPTYVRKALQDLRFEAIGNRFGMFFMHDLDLVQGTLEGIDAKDDSRVEYAMRAVTRRRRQEKSIGQANPPPSSDRELLYPYGETPTWPTIADAIRTTPNVLMRPWAWQETWSQHRLAARLFVQMTVDIWLTVAGDTLLIQPPHPDTLEEAMQTWTVTSIQEIFMNPSFVASNASLQGGKGKKHILFDDMAAIFFPPRGKVFAQKSVWRPLAEKGYIKEFYRVTEQFSTEQLGNLNNALRILFRHVQCLPPALACGNGRKMGRIWKSTRGMVELVTNSRYYRVIRIGTHAQKRKYTGRVKASNAVISARLDEEHRGIPYGRGRKRQYNPARRSRQTGRCNPCK
jgi:hypothetical protein